jgi:hypothetical protein
MEKKVQHENFGRKSATGKVLQKYCGRKIVEEKVQ